MLRTTHETTLRILPSNNEVRTKCTSNLVDLLTVRYLHEIAV
jgi:hypothetical protein